MNRPTFPSQTYLDIAKEHAHCLLPPTKTEPEERLLYEDSRVEDPPNLRDRIQLAIVLLAQNEELEKKISAANRQLEEERLKHTIFQQNVARNESALFELKRRRDQLQQFQNDRLLTLNQSSIPNKSQEMSTTYNSSWNNEFLDKEWLESLWNKSKPARQESKAQKVAVKTIDLSLPSQRSLKQQKLSLNAMNQSITSKGHIQAKLRGEKSKIKDSAWEKGKKYAEMHGKKYQQLQEKNPHRPISELRRGKKIRNNPEQ